MFQKLKLSTKIALLVAASLLGLLFAVIYSATSMRNDMFEARRLQIRSVTEAVYNTLTDIEAQAKAGKLSDEQAKKAGIDALRTARYGGSDGKTEYFYAYTMKGVNTFHIRPEFMGQDLLEKIKDGQGRYVIKDLLAALQGKRLQAMPPGWRRP